MHIRCVVSAVLCLSVLHASGSIASAPDKAASIVAFFSPVTSHWLQFQPILEELILRGHHVKVHGSDGDVDCACVQGPAYPALASVLFLLNCV